MRFNPKSLTHTLALNCHLDRSGEIYLAIDVSTSINMKGTLAAQV
jgi:hypothetical protein